MPETHVSQWLNIVNRVPHHSWVLDLDIDIDALAFTRARFIVPVTNVIFVGCLDPPKFVSSSTIGGWPGCNGFLRELSFQLGPEPLIFRIALFESLSRPAPICQTCLPLSLQSLLEFVQSTHPLLVPWIVLRRPGSGAVNHGPSALR